MNTLRITERFAAPLARVFSAWTDAAVLRRWFAPGDMRVPEAIADVRPGGRYRIVMEQADGQQHIVTGEFRDVIPNERLAFTWQWEGSEAVTLVEIVFRAIDANHTELNLVHTQFGTTDARDKHGQGWRGCLVNLHTHLSA
jgi:uncharacterized protein YndB with AHSA1/START domain